MKHTEEQKQKDWDNITREITSFIKKYEIPEFKIEWTYNKDKGDVLSTSIKKTPNNQLRVFLKNKNEYYTKAKNAVIVAGSKLGANSLQVAVPVKVYPFKSAFALPVDAFTEKSTPSSKPQAT